MFHLHLVNQFERFQSLFILRSIRINIEERNSFDMYNLRPVFENYDTRFSKYIHFAKAFICHFESVARDGTDGRLCTTHFDHQIFTNCKLLNSSKTERWKVKVPADGIDVALKLN